MFELPEELRPDCRWSDTHPEPDVRYLKLKYIEINTFGLFDEFWINYADAMKQESVVTFYWL